MSLQKLISMTSRLFFLGAFVLFGLALIERVANATGYTILDQATSTAPGLRDRHTAERDEGRAQEQKALGKQLHFSELTRP